uniref:uncharacterized protein LOC108950256 isoform X1 n=1 Tax=Ciona intestinalis TaxID=7719 RepID=UPI00089DBF07|nr:uncharacterized protein LOC108950256 isoform X1 [Ciona intestinalis]|eukprot:XP_018671041.1 uncharacterized protein LOC108950256 isoform X1 [Ciona intestinalis]
MVNFSESSPFDYIRYVISFTLLSFSIAVTSYAIFEGRTGFWPQVPGPAAFALFLVCLFLLGVVEGLQISLVELKRMHPGTYKTSYPRAYKLSCIAGKGDNVERFLMGRQVFVVFLVFFIAKLTTIVLEDLNSDFFFPVPHWLYVSLLETGFITCVLVVIVAQLMPQIVAAKFPVHFLDMRIMFIAYYACIFVEMSGVTHACWLLSHLFGKLAGMKDKIEVKVSPSYPDSDDCLPTYGDSCAQDGGDHDVKIALRKVGECIQSGLPTYDAQSTIDKIRSVNKGIDVELSEDKQRILRCYLDNHPEKFYAFPSVIGNKAFPAPQELAEQFRRMNSEVPGFLRDISDPGHVPPHIVACELLLLISELNVSSGIGGIVTNKVDSGMS